MKVYIDEGFSLEPKHRTFRKVNSTRWATINNQSFLPNELISPRSIHAPSVLVRTNKLESALHIRSFCCTQ
jgi:hypothetical protein